MRAAALFLFLFPAVMVAQELNPDQLFQRATEEHRMLLDLCRKKDVSAACNLLHSHISRAGRSLKEFVSVQRERARELAEREHSHSATAE